MSFYQYYEAPQATDLPPAGGFYQQGQQSGYAMTGTGSYTVAGSTTLQQPMSAYRKAMSACRQAMSAYRQAMSAYGQPVQYVQAQPSYYPSGQFGYSPATPAYANPTPTYMSQYPVGFAGGAQYLQPTPTGYGEVQTQMEDLADFEMMMEIQAKHAQYLAQSISGIGGAVSRLS